MKNIFSLREDRINHLARSEVVIMGQMAQASFLEQLSLEQPLSNEQLEQMKGHLDLIFLSLEALAGISSDAVVQAAHALKLETILADRMRLWRLRQYHPWKDTKGQLNGEEIRALVAIAAYLAKEHHELIRRAVGLLEQVVEQHQEPQATTLLGDYLTTFGTICQRADPQAHHPLALKLLIELLFYSSSGGHRRLWLTLINRFASID